MQLGLDGGEVPHQLDEPMRAPDPVQLAMEQVGTGTIDAPSLFDVEEARVEVPTGSDEVRPDVCCELCPTSSAAWMEPGGIVHWQLMDPRYVQQAVVVHARSLDEAGALLREREKAGTVSPVAYVKARRCFGCAKWWSPREAQREGQARRE